MRMIWIPAMTMALAATSLGVAADFYIAPGWGHGHSRP